jgi:hypothetical protein
MNSGWWLLAFGICKRVTSHEIRTDMALTHKKIIKGVIAVGMMET